MKEGRHERNSSCMECFALSETASELGSYKEFGRVFYRNEFTVPSLPANALTFCSRSRKRVRIHCSRARRNADPATESDRGLCSDVARSPAPMRAATPIPPRRAITAYAATWGTT